MQNVNTERKASDADRQSGELFAQDVRVWRRQLIRGILLALVIVGPVAMIAGSYYAYATQTAWLIPLYLLIYGLLLVVTFWRRMPYTLQVVTFLALVYALTLLDFLQDGRGGSGRTFLLVIVSLSVLFFKRWTAVVILVLAMLTVVGFGIAYTTGLLVLPPAQEVNSADPTGWISNVTVLLMMSILMLAAQGFLVPRLTAALQQSQQLARDLEVQRVNLEQVVAERTEALSRRARYLEATADVARSVSAVLEIHDLLALVVNLIGERFGFYQVGLFFIVPSGEWAVLQAAFSAGGRQMLARGHQLRVGQQGIVGDVAASGQARIALDVGQDAVYFDNPDLPETRSEMALPLRARGEVIGVLDVQSREQAAFTQEDVSVLQTLADQVALAISNARLFALAQEGLEAERRAYGQLSAEAWRALLQEQPDLGFIKVGDAILPVAAEWDIEAERVVETGRPLQRGDAVLAVPVKSGDQVIAVLDVRLPAGSGAWTSEQVALLETLSEQVSQAMERARLYRDTQRRAAREQLIGEVTGRIRETLDVETILRTATSELRQALNLNGMLIRLAVPKTEADSD